MSCFFSHDSSYIFPDVMFLSTWIWDMGTVPWIFFWGEGSLKPTRFNASYGSSVGEGGHLSEVCLLHRLAFLLDNEFVGGQEEAGP